MNTLKPINLKANNTKVMGPKDSQEEESDDDDAKELLQKLTLIIGEMEAGNTSIQMRNTGQSILDTLLRTKAINKSQYQKLVKKYFKI